MNQRGSGWFFRDEQLAVTSSRSMVQVATCCVRLDITVVHRVIQLSNVYNLRAFVC